MLNALKKNLSRDKLKRIKYIYIYSDFRLFFEQNKKNPEKSVKLILDFFIKKGITCIVPSFTYTTSGKFFVDKTKSKVGFLSNFIMKRFLFARSEHPIFSFVAIGKNKKIVKKIGKSAVGNNSVHKRLLNQNSYFFHLCRPLSNGNTLVHHIEQIKSANYRFDKKFKTKVFHKNKYIGCNYSAYLRRNPKNSKTLFTFNKVMKTLKKKKYIKSFKADNLKIEFYKYDLIYKDLSELFQKNNKIFIRS